MRNIWWILPLHRIHTRTNYISITVTGDVQALPEVNVLKINERDTECPIISFCVVHTQAGTGAP